MKDVITSPRNPLVARVRDAAAGKRESEVVADGWRLVGDALDAGLSIPLALTSPALDLHRHGSALRRRLEQHAVECLSCSDAVLARASSLTTHQGVLAVVARRAITPSALLGRHGDALIVAAAGVRDPGNLGAMLRVAEASGGTGFVALRGGADPFRDKAVRGSAGSVFRLPTVAGADADWLAALRREHGVRLCVADGRATLDYLDADLRGPLCVIVGGEGDGVPEDVQALADLRVRIPMAEPVESLNAAVATGVLLFEVRRQRR